MQCVSQLQANPSHHLNQANMSGDPILQDVPDIS